MKNKKTFISIIFWFLFAERSSFWYCYILLTTIILVKNKEIRSNDTFVDDSSVIFDQLEGVVGLKIFDQISQFSFRREMNPSGFDIRSMDELRILRSSK